VEESGHEQVEFAVSAVLLLSVIFGMFAVCQLLYCYHYVAYVAREGTRYAAVRGSTWHGTLCAASTSLNCTASATNVATLISDITPLGFLASNLVVSTTWPGTTPTGAGCASTNGVNSPGCTVVVKVTYSYRYTVPFIPAVVLPLSSTSSLAISR
jgi:Flp pilus assembly protein TadG